MNFLDTLRVSLAVGACSAALMTIASTAVAQSGPAQTGPALTASPSAAAAPAPAKQAKAPRKKAGAADAAAEPAAPTKKDPAEASRQVEGGIKLLQADKAEQAVQTLSVAIASGTLAPTNMARALYHRGAGYRKTGKPAQAISDLTSALYVKGGLNEADRQDALKQRASAYREAGLPDQTGEDGKSVGSGSRRATAAGTPVAAGESRAPAPVTTASLAPGSGAAAAAPSTGGLFATLFGGLNRPQAQAAQPAPVAPAATPQPQATTSGWSSDATTVRPARTASQPSAPKAATAPTAPPTPAAAPAPVKTAAVGASAASVAAPVAAPAAGGFHARIALVRNDAEAQPILQRLKSQYAAALAGKPATLSQAQFGGMGSFTQVRVGPYASKAEADALCVRLKGSGLDCVTVDQ